MKFSIFTSLLFHLCCLALLTIHFDICNSYSSKVGCIQSEREALLSFKYNLIDHTNRLSSWNASNPNCCEWVGVVCSHITTNVLQLHLNSSPPILDDGYFYYEYDAYGQYYYYHDYEYEEAFEAYERSRFGGVVNGSLIELKHLTHLDLSGNDFGDMQIPTFIWEMTSLTYLDLSIAGFNGIIPPRIGNLSNLLYLGLSGATLSGTIPSEIWNLSNLLHLDLSYATLSGTIPSEIGNLTNLLYLGIGSGYYKHQGLHWLSRLSQLQYLNLENVNLPNSLDWLQTLQALPSLMELRLSECILPTHYNHPPLLNFSSLLTLDISSNRFSFVPKWVFGLRKLVSLELQDNNIQGPIPDGIQNLTLFENLDLSHNSFSSSIPDWLYSLHHLKFLNLGWNRLCGNISDALGNLTSLVKLDLSFNYQLEGKISPSFGNLCNLREIYFSDLKLNQRVNEILEILTPCVSQRLTKLIIESSQLSGNLTDQIGLFKNIHRLDFFDNSIHGSLPRSFANISSLRTLDLSKNQFNGNPFEVLTSLSELSYLAIYDNLFQGVVTKDDLANFTSLKVFFASGNNFTLEVGPNWHPNFHLYALQMRSWKLGPHFPTWILSQKSIYNLDLSNTGISDSIHPWFWEMFSRVEYLNLSHNHIHGELACTSVKPIDAVVVDLSSNVLRGKLPYFFTWNISSLWLDLSSNSFSGFMTDFLCKKQDNQLEFLNLAYNNLSGEIPDCWERWPYLVNLNLQSNHLVGNLPLSIGSLTMLEVLQIRSNSISETFPTFLKKNNNLICLDFGENKFKGTIPTWIGERLSKLKILRLRSNEFSSHIPKEICDMIFLQDLDFAKNNFSRSIPNCFNQLNAMMVRNKSKDLFMHSDLPIGFMGIDEVIVSSIIWVAGKGIEYTSILGLVTNVDLSDNNLSGEIPQEITNLDGLIYLNLSRNQLSGQIPQHIGNMISLEHIDFSWNQLSGEIPPTISNISFLKMLDLSHNHLKGTIPIGTQLQSFDASDFIGNNLCGPPLPVNCSSHKQIPNDDHNDKESSAHGVNWFFVTMALGFIMGFWAVVAPLFISRSWRHTYYRFLDDMWYKMQSCW